MPLERQELLCVWVGTYDWKGVGDQLMPASRVIASDKCNYPNYITQHNNLPFLPYSIGKNGRLSSFVGEESVIHA